MSGRCRMWGGVGWKGPLGAPNGPDSHNKCSAQAIPQIMRGLLGSHSHSTNHVRQDEHPHHYHCYGETTNENLPTTGRRHRICRQRRQSTPRWSGKHSALCLPSYIHSCIAMKFQRHGHGTMFRTGGSRLQSHPHRTYGRKRPRILF